MATYTVSLVDINGDSIPKVYAAKSESDFTVRYRVTDESDPSDPVAIRDFAPTLIEFAEYREDLEGGCKPIACGGVIA